jgi:PKD repeat protein
VYKDGVKVNGGNYVGGLALDTANQFQIGASGLGTEVSFRLDEFRYTQGVSRFVSDFSVPFAAYRGSLTGFIDTSPNSTYRYKTDPGSIAGISNWTNGGTRNRTVQVQNISEANYLVGGGNFDPLHEQVRAVYLNFTNYPDLVLESYSIDNVGGIVAYNVSRGGTNKITALFDNRTNFLDVEVLYYNYTETSDDFQYFAYGTLINGTASFPIHNFIATPITYLTWTIYPNFSASSTMVPAGTPITFTDTTYGAPGGWTNYAWTFGDGGTSTNKNPVYTYTLPGTYTVGLTTSLVANSSVTNSTTKTSYITVTSSGSGSPVASFAGSPLITTANSTVTFTDSSTNSPLSWTWDFGDGSGSTLQNPAHSYITNGLYTVNLTATNAYGSNTLSRVAYINVTSSIPSSFAQQDIWMDGQYALTFHVTDASTAAPIPVVTITDSNGASTTTTNGTGYLTEPAGTVSVCFVVSSGYTNICKSYIVDADASYDVQLSTASTEVANTNIVYTQQQTRFIVQNSYGNPVVGAGITAYYVSSTLPSNSAEVLQKAFGINSAIAELMLNSSVAMDGNTGSDGSLTFMMFPSLTYNLTITNVPSEPWYISVNPRETEYTIHQPLVVANSSYQNKTMTNITFDEPNSSYIRFKATFRDLSGATTDVKYFVVNPTNHTLYYTIDLGNPGTNIVKDFNYTGPNVRGEPYWAYFNTTP